MLLSHDYTSIVRCKTLHICNFHTPQLVRATTKLSSAGKSKACSAAGVLRAPTGGCQRTAQCRTPHANGNGQTDWTTWSDRPDLPVIERADDGAEWKTELNGLVSTLRSPEGHEPPVDDGAEEQFEEKERAYLVGASIKRDRNKYSYNVHDSLQELARLADTAGLEVVGQTFQLLDSIHPHSYVGSGKVQEIAAAVKEARAQTVIFDDELSPGQLRNLEQMLGGNVRLCDRTALILDIFSQRAATREGQLQVELAQSSYQLPRLTRMWTHLERQSGGKVKGMGEKQIEVDKRLLRQRMALLRRELEEVRTHRKQYRDRRAAAPIPVVALVGYTNAGKSTLLNRLTGAAVLSEDKLFATLDPTTRRTTLASGKEVLFTDTVGFIQKLPTQLVAAFRATLEEIQDASLLLHVVDVSHSNAAAQTEAVNNVLSEMNVKHLPVLHVWNKVDLCAEPGVVSAIASDREGVVCGSAATGEGMEELLEKISDTLEQTMVKIEVLLPYAQGELLDELHRVGIVKEESFGEDGTRVVAFVPPSLGNKLRQLGLTTWFEEAATTDIAAA